MNFNQLKIIIKIIKMQQSQQQINLLPQLSVDQYDFEDDDNQSIKLNLFYTVITIMKSIIGAGIFGLPLVFATFGWALAITIILLIAIFNQFACILLIQSKNLCDRSNYSTIGQSIFNSPLNKKIIKAFIHIIIILCNCGLCVTYIYFLTNTIYCRFKNIQLYTRIIICIVLFLFTMVKKIQKLRFLALLGIIATLIYMILMLISVLSLKINNVDYAAFRMPYKEQIGLIPTILFAFLYQMNFFPIYKSIQNRNDQKDQKMIKSSKISIIICCIIYITFGLLGYIIAGQNQNFINSQNFLLILYDQLSQHQILQYSLIFIILLSLFCSFPLIFFAARNNFLALIEMIRPPPQSTIINNPNNDACSYKIKKIFLFVLTLILYLVILVIEIFVKKPNDIFNIIGSFAANTVCFILPTAFYCLLVIKNNQMKTKNFYMAGIVLLISLPFGIIAVILHYQYNNKNNNNNSNSKCPF